MLSRISSLCLGLALIALPTFAAPPLASGQAPATVLSADAWVQVQNGVLQMQDEDGRLHHVTWGKAGQQWLVSELEAQLGRMLVDAAQSGDGALDGAIAQHQKIILSERALLAAGTDLGSEHDAWEATKAVAKCDVTFSYVANAWASGGASATADYEAVGGSSCPLGTVYAYAYGRTTKCGTTTTSSQTDPNSTGLDVSGSAATSLASVGFDLDGTDPSRDCYGYAYASVKLGGTTYSTSDSSDFCQPHFYDPCP